MSKKPYKKFIADFEYSVDLMDELIQFLDLDEETMNNCHKAIKLLNNKVKDMKENGAKKYINKHMLNRIVIEGKKERIEYDE
jgi:hypothetical protein